MHAWPFFGPRDQAFFHPLAENVLQAAHLALGCWQGGWQVLVPHRAVPADARVVSPAPRYLSLDEANEGWDLGRWAAQHEVRVVRQERHGVQLHILVAAQRAAYDSDDDCVELLARLEKMTALKDP